MASSAYVGRASALPLSLIAQAIPKLTRHELTVLTERLVDALNLLTPDPDREPDDEDTAIDDYGCDDINDDREEDH